MFSAPLRVTASEDMKLGALREECGKLNFLLLLQRLSEREEIPNSVILLEGKKNGMNKEQGVLQ